LVFVCCSKGEQKVESVKLLQREQELAEKEAQVCRNQWFLYWEILRITLLICLSARFFAYCMD